MQQRDDEARAAHPERVAERDRAAVHVHALGVEAELADRRRGSARRTPRSARRGRSRRRRCPARASSFRTAGIGPMPITRGSTPATALPTNAPSGSTPSVARLLLADAITSAAAPSLMPARVARGDGAALAERRLQRRELLERRVGPRMLVAHDVADGDELVVEAAGLGGGRPALLRPKRKRVLVLARDAPALGDVLAGLAHRLEREHLLHAAGSGSASRGSCRRASGRRAGTPCRASPSTSGARLIDSTPPATKRSPSPAATAWQAATTAESPEAHSRLTVTPATESGSPARRARHPRDVAVVLARLVGAAEVDVLDLACVDARALHGGRDHLAGQVVRPHARERAAVTPDGRAHCREDRPRVPRGER